MTNRFSHKGWATKQPLDYYVQVEMRGAMFSISVMFILEGMAVERAWGFGLWLSASSAL